MGELVPLRSECRKLQLADDINNALEQAKGREAVYPGRGGLHERGPGDGPEEWEEMCPRPGPVRPWACGLAALLLRREED